MINIAFLSIISFDLVVSFFIGVSIALSISLIYYKYFRKSIISINDISRINQDESAPLFTLLNNLPDSIFIKDIAGKYIIANDNFSSLLKMEKISELIGMSDSDLYPKIIAEKYIQEDQIILSGEKEVFIREKKSDNNGTIKHTITRKYPLKNKFGKIIGVVGICSDTTEQHLTDKMLSNKNDAIEKERNLLRTLIDNMPDTIYIKDAECNFLDANTTQIAITKAKSHKDILGKSDYDFYPKDIADIFHKDDKNIIDSGEGIINKEEIGFDKNGNIKVISTTKVPFFDDKNNVIGLVGIGRDITKLKETEEKLIEQSQSLQEINVLLEERQEEINQQSDELSDQNSILESERNLLRIIIDNIPDSIYIKDKNSCFITANKQMLDYFKLKHPHEIQGKSDFDLFSKEIAENFYAEEQKIINSGIAKIDTEKTKLDKNGNTIHTISSKIPFKNSDGEVEGIVGIAKNVTALKSSEIKLQEQTEYLKEVNVLLEERQEEIQQQSEELNDQNSILENEKNLLRTLIDNIPDSIFIKDNQSRFILANKPLMNKLNIRSIDELEGKTDYDFYSRDQAAKFTEIEKDIIKNEEPVINKEEIRILNNGEKKYRNITKVPYFDEDGRILGIVGITKDITKLKTYQNQLELQTTDLKEINQLLEERSEEILKQSEWLEEQNIIVEKERALLRTLIDNMPDFIYIKDTESRFITVNKRLLSILRADKLEDVIGKTDFDLFPLNQAAQEFYDDELRIIKSGKAMINKEEISFDETGKEKIVSTTKVPFRDIDGKILGVVGIGRDITKQKNTEKKLIEQADSLKEINILLEERQEKIQIQAEKLNLQASSLKNANIELEELNATKNKFFSIIAHDLKNPFQAIFGFSELLMRNFEDFEEKQRLELLGMIKTSSEGAYNLLENLLQWARTQTKRIKYSPTSLNVHDIIQQNITLSQPNADKKDIIIRADNNCSGIAWADFNMVNLIVRNLTSNAIKFTDNNGLITISCSDSSADRCIISIKDTGIGISEDNIKKLFRIDEYFSTSGTAGENGTGLGLIICKEFIEKNHGKLSVESEIGVGTKFSFYLPRTEQNISK